MKRRNNFFGKNLNMTNRLFYTLIYILFFSSITFTVSAIELQFNTPSVKKGNSYFINLKTAFNKSCFDDGIADNNKGGWTDEGFNDFYIYPEIKFGLKRYRGYLFDFVNPKSDNGKNLVLIGHAKKWKNLPKTVSLNNVNAKGKYFFMMHSEGLHKSRKDGEKGATITLIYADDTKASYDMLLQRDMHDWYTKAWWSCYEEALPNASEALKKSKCDPNKYKKLGGENFHKAVLDHAIAKRWPVLQGYNSISTNWGMMVTFWGFKWVNPFPNKMIKTIKINSCELNVMGIAAITITDEDFSMLRQTEQGKMRKAKLVTAGFFEKRSENFSDSCDKLAKQSWTKGLRDLELRSDDILTVHVDHIAKISGLKNKENFIIFSTDDKRFSKGLNPLEVYRFSRGGRARKIDKGEFKTYIDHWLHLKLPYKMKKDATYIIKLADKIIPAKYKKLKTQATFKPKDLYNPSFKLNQVGYSKNAGNKFVYLSSYLGDGPAVNLDIFKKFTIIDSKNKKTVFEGKITKVSDCDIQGNDKLYLLDISKFDKPGTFQIEVDGLGRSYPFLNGNKAAEKMYEICHRGLYFQRSGQEVKEPYAEGWLRPMAHNKIYVTKENLTSPLPFGKVDPTQKGKWFSKAYEIHGGHYDAGDYDLRPMHINVPEKLLTLYEAFPNKFYDGQVNIPEKNNGIPDIIDEAAWNLLSLEYIQDYATKIRGLNGGVAPGMETYTHPGPGQAMDKDPLPYYMRKVTGPFSLCAAAEFAHIARIIKPYDTKRAAKYLARAKRAYKYGYKHANEPLPKKLDQGQGWNKDGVILAKVWANIELYCTTGEKKYWDEIIKYKDAKRGSIAGTIDLKQARFSLLLSKRNHPDPKYVSKLKNEYMKVSYGLNFVKNNAKNGYAASTYNRGAWGGTSCVVRNIEGLTRAYMLSKDPELLKPIATSIDFSLGMNPSEISWMTGAGSKYPMDPLNLNCLDDGIENPHPGILWYGPTSYWNDTKVVLYPNKSKMGFYRRVVDNWMMVGQCEYTVWETQAPFIFAVGCLLPDKK